MDIERLKGLPSNRQPASIVAEIQTRAVWFVWNASHDATLCSLPSLTVALPADRTQRRVTAEELTTDRDKPHLNNGEQIKTYKTWEHTCFWGIISCQSHRLRWWRWRVVRDSPNSLFLTELLRLYLFMRLASPCFPFPLSASLLGIGNSFTYVVFFYISFMRNSFRP